MCELTLPMSILLMVSRMDGAFRRATFNSWVEGRGGGVIMRVTAGV